MQGVTLSCTREELAAAGGGFWLGPACRAAGALICDLPGRGGARVAMTSAGRLIQLAGLAGLRQAVWVRGAAGLLTEVDWRLAGAASW